MKLTLSRQLTVLLTAIVLLLLSVSLVISFNSSRQYVTHQLVSHAQDAATSLGISASSAIGQNDLITLRSLAGAMFHSGDYQKIQVFDINRQQIFSQVQAVNVQGIPRWFIDYVDLNLHVGRASLMQGWSQLGTVEVVSHPGYAYRQLWDASIGLVQWFVSVSLVVTVISLLLLRKLMLPLQQVERQSRSIMRREFQMIDTIPATQEFRTIVLAMNQMTGSIRKMLQQADESAQQLRDQLHRDALTGLLNKKHFYEILSHRMSHQTPMSHALLALIQLKDFKSINQHSGYEAGDDLLKQTAEVLVSCLADFENRHIARLSGADFAVFIEDMMPQQADMLGQKLSAGLFSLAASSCLFKNSKLQDIGCVGLCAYSGEQNLPQLMSLADQALRQASAEKPNSWFVSPMAAVQPATKDAWRKRIKQALDNDWLFLQRQPVLLAGDRKILHEEVFIRLAENGDASKAINAGQFMPTAHEMGLASSIDRVVVEKAMQLLKADMQLAIAINLSVASLDDDDFLEWLQMALSEEISAEYRASSRLTFEFSEFAVINKLDQLSAFQGVIAAQGASLALDHVGAGFTSFVYLSEIALRYLKIDGSYFQNIENDKQKQLLVKALADIAQGLDISVIAESVETEQTWQVVEMLGLDAGQGNYLAKLD